MERLEIKIPDKLKELLQEISDKSDTSMADILRLSLTEFLQARGYDVPVFNVKWGGHRLENYITKNGWVNERKIAIEVYGLTNRDLSQVDIDSHDEWIQEYPLLVAAAKHNEQRFNEVFAYCEWSPDKGDPIYDTYVRETGL